ncbi:hypothetical protein RJT34_28406 [Clitoria ternatea]|uniref:Mitochondrial import inner membrane translocase subunit n=1 Tax=Clitoria ternatea TaxID=43366 RepID=A0AAN9FAW0_CLITE
MEPHYHYPFYLREALLCIVALALAHKASHPGMHLLALIHSYLEDTMAANNMSAFDKEQIFGMAEKEMEYRVELFNKMTQTCFKKCVDNRYKESELNMGENSCIDRCVSKYWHVTNLIGQLLGSGRPPM